MSCVMLERTQVMRAAHSLKLSGAPASTRCVSAANLALDNSTSSSAASMRCSRLRATCSSEKSIWSAAGAGVRALRRKVGAVRLFIYE